MNYYNEFDPFAAQWLRNLIDGGAIPAGDVDDRDIREVKASDLTGYTQCHFFAGIGGWSRALQLAGWPTDRPVWTGSCPCQPWSVAGKGGGEDDERHLWPTWRDLIRIARPERVFGEQVASKDGLVWLDSVSLDMEEAGYEIGATDLPIAGFGGFNIRQRFWFEAQLVGDRDGQRPEQPESGRRLLSETVAAPPRQESKRAGSAHGMANAERGSAERHGSALGRAARASEGEGHQRERLRSDSGHGLDADRLADATGQRHDRRRTGGQSDEPGAQQRSERLCTAGRVADAERPEGARQRSERRESVREQTPQGLAGMRVADGLQSAGSRPGLFSGEDAGLAGSGWPCEIDQFWAAADWLHCRDGKFRPVEPGTLPLADGVPGRMGRLSAYGNAISPVVGAAFIIAAEGW